MTRTSDPDPAQDAAFENLLWELDVTRAHPGRPDPRLARAAPSSRPWTAATPIAAELRHPAAPATHEPAPAPVPEPLPGPRPSPRPSQHGPARRRRRFPFVAVLRILAGACLVAGTALLVYLALNR